MQNRLGNGLSAVADKPGQVDVEPKTRSLGAILALLPMAYHYLKKEFLYGDAEEYNERHHFL